MENTKKEFKYKVNENSVTISKYIGKQTTANIPELIENLTVTKIGKNAFINCGLSEIRIPDTVIEIENNAFQNNCLTNVVLPNSIKKIGISTFQENKLEKLFIPEKLLIIDYWSFADNMLTDVQFHSNLLEIRAYAFENNKLTNISLPDSLKEIGASSFGNNNLTELSLSNSVNETGKPILLDKLTHIKLIDLEYNHTMIASKFVTYEGTVIKTKLGKTYKGKNYESILLSDNESSYNLLLCDKNFDTFNNVFKIGVKYEITKEIILSDWSTNGGFRLFNINSVIEK
jgi:hypothetical protein